MLLYISARQANRATQEVANELGASRLDQPNQAVRARRSEDRADSLFQPVWRADALLIASLKEAFAPAWAER